MTDLTTPAPTPRAGTEQFEQAVDELEQSRLDVYRAGLPIGRMDPRRRRHELEEAIAHHAAARQALRDAINADIAEAVTAMQRRAEAAERDVALLEAHLRDIGPRAAVATDLREILKQRDAELAASAAVKGGREAVEGVVYMLDSTLSPHDGVCVGIDLPKPCSLRIGARVLVTRLPEGEGR